jgi:hypothetical protein
MSNLPGRVRKHEFDVETPQRVPVFQAQCEDFRHGTEWSFDGVLWLDPHFDGQSLVVVEITAANLRGTFTTPFSIDRQVEALKVSDLVEEKSGKYLRQSFVLKQITRALDEETYDIIEWGGSDPDE